MVDILPINSPALSATSDMPPATPVVTTPTNSSSDTVPVTTPVEPTVTTTETTPAVTPAPPKEPIGARLSELSRQRREADERAARLELLVGQQGEQLTKALEALTKVSSQAKPQVSTQTSTGISRPRPTRDEFSDPTDFEVALVSWASEEAASRAASEMERRQEEARAEADRVAEEARLAREADDQRVREQAANNELRNSWNSKREAALAIHEDFAEVAENPSIAISDPMALVIMNSDDGAEIAYYLGKHPDEAAKIAAMVVPGQVFPSGTPKAGLPVPDHIKQAVAMGRLAAKLGLDVQTTTSADTNANALVTPASVPVTASVPATPAPTQTIVLAPSPPNPISGANANATQRTLYDAGNEGSMEEYAAMRRPQLLAERRPGRALN